MTKMQRNIFAILKKYEHATLKMRWNAQYDVS